MGCAKVRCGEGSVINAKLVVLCRRKVGGDIPLSHVRGKVEVGVVVESLNGAVANDEVVEMVEGGGVRKMGGEGCEDVLLGGG